jgi:hypothetical protein
MKDVKTILAFGDSLTWGYNAADGGRHAFEDRWPNALGAKLGAGYRVIAEGLNGRTTVHDDNLVDELRNGVKALPMLLSSHQPLDLVIIALGTNDLKHPWWSRACDAKRGVQRLVEITQRFPYGVGMRTPKILVNTTSSSSAAGPAAMSRRSAPRSSAEDGDRRARASGGICLNWGCIPTKALLRSAEIYHYAKHAKTTA